MDDTCGRPVGVGVAERTPEGEDGRDLEVLVIHRPRYDDWTLPKGKAEPGDADLMATARREVWEETGLRCRLGADLGEVGYIAKGRPKVVHYWSMQADEGSFAANDEVDEVEWMTPGGRPRTARLPPRRRGRRPLPGHLGLILAGRAVGRPFASRSPPVHPTPQDRSPGLRTFASVPQQTKETGT